MALTTAVCSSTWQSSSVQAENLLGGQSCLAVLISQPQDALQVQRCYTGPQDADIVDHVKACNPRGPLLVHIAKLYPKQDCSTFDAFGRVFSGTVKPGDRVRLACLLYSATSCLHQPCALSGL